MADSPDNVGLLDYIHELADGDSPPTAAEMDAAAGTPSTKMYRTRFGSWNAAIEAAGYESRDPDADVYTRQELLNYIHELANGDTPPGKEEMDAAADTPAAETYRRRFGSWKGAVEQAGYEPRSQTRSRAELLDYIDTMADGDSPPSANEMDDRPDAPSSHTYQRRFGSWNAALEAAGYESRTPAPERYSREELLEHIHKATDGDSPPTEQILRETDDGPSVTAYQSEFGSWTAAVEAAGYDSSEGKERYSREELLEHIQGVGDDGPPTMAEMDAAGDTPSAHTYWRRFGSWGAALEAAGYRFNP